MPGKNSKFDVSKTTLLDRIFCYNLYLWICLVIVMLNVFGMFRAYYLWPDRRNTLECYFLTIFWGFCDIQIFTGIKVTHDSDPGYILPDMD